MYSQLLLHLKKHQRYRLCWFNLKKPGFTAKKGVTPNRIYYIQIHLRKYSGTNVALYLKRGKRYSKIQLKSSSIQKYQGIFKLQCNRRHKIYYLKVRTYIWQKGKIYYSPYSKVVKVRILQIKTAAFGYDKSSGFCCFRARHTLKKFQFLKINPEIIININLNLIMERISLRFNIGLLKTIDKNLFCPGIYNPVFPDPCICI